VGRRWHRLERRAGEAELLDERWWQLVAPASIQNAGDRGYYAAPALSPNGTDLYVFYNAFTTPFRDDTTSTRSLIGVVKHIGGGGAPTNWTTLYSSPPGDPRGLGQNGLTAEFLGDYVYAAATRTCGAAVWNDARNAAICLAINAYWAAPRGSIGPEAGSGGRLPVHVGQHRHLRRLLVGSNAVAEEQSDKKGRLRAPLLLAATRFLLAATRRGFVATMWLFATNCADWSRTDVTGDGRVPSAPVAR